MNLSLDWATLNQRIQEYGEKSDDADTVLGDNVSLVPVEGAGRGLRAERDLAGGQVMSVICKDNQNTDGPVKFFLNCKDAALQVLMYVSLRENLAQSFHAVT